MSINNILKIGITSTLGFVLGYTAFSVMGQQSISKEQFRQPSSIQFQKMGFDQLSKEYFDVQVKSIHISETENGISHLKAIITAKKNIPLNTIQYHWKVKSEMNSNDTLVGYLPELKPGEVYEINLNSNNFSKELQKHIQILFIGQIESHNIHRQLTIASRPEDSLEYMIAHDSIEKVEDSKQKIKKMSLRNKFDPKKIIK